MSWSTSKQGTPSEAAEHVATEIRNSASYDETMTEKAEAVAGAAKDLIEAAASDLPEGKIVSVYSSGHVDHYGMSTFSLGVSFVDASVQEEVAEPQEAAAAEA